MDGAALQVADQEMIGALEAFVYRAWSDICTACERAPAQQLCVSLPVTREIERFSYEALEPLQAVGYSHMPTACAQARPRHLGIARIAIPRRGIGCLEGPAAGEAEKQADTLHATDLQACYPQIGE